MLTTLKTKRNFAQVVRTNQTNAAPPKKSRLGRNLFFMTLVAALAGGSSYWYYQTQQEGEAREESMVKMIKERLRTLRQQLPKNNTNTRPAIDVPANTNDSATSSVEENTNVASSTNQQQQQAAPETEIRPIATADSEEPEVSTANESQQEQEASDAMRDEVVAVFQSVAVPVVIAVEELQQQQQQEQEQEQVEGTEEEGVSYDRSDEASKSIDALLAKLSGLMEEGEGLDNLEDEAVDRIPSELDAQGREEREAELEAEAEVAAQELADALERFRVDLEVALKAQREADEELARQEQEEAAREERSRQEQEQAAREERARQEQEQAAREQEQADQAARQEQQRLEDEERIALLRGTLKAQREADEERARQEQEQAAREAEEAQQKREAERQREALVAVEQAAQDQERLRQETKDGLIAEIHDVLQSKTPKSATATSATGQADSQYSAVIANDVVQALLNKILAEKMDRLATEQEIVDLYNIELEKQKAAHEEALEGQAAQYNAFLEVMHAAYEREIDNFMRLAKDRYDEELKYEFNNLVGESEVVHDEIIKHHFRVQDDYEALLKLYARQDVVVYETEGMLRNVQAYLALESINDNAGYPFAQQLSDVTKLVQNDDFMSRILARITPTAANSGIRTLHQLQDDFNSVDLQTRQKAQNESSESTGFFSSLFASSPKQFPAGLVPGDDYNAILARAKYYLQSKGNLDKAISELDQLPPVLKEQCESWIERANDRRNLDDVTRTFRARVLLQTTNARDTWSSVMPVNIQRQFEDRQ